MLGSRTTPDLEAPRGVECGSCCRRRCVGPSFSFASDDGCGSVCYVDSTNGNDANPGTEAEPFRTISAAVEAVEDGGTIHVAPGTYDVTNYWLAKSVTLLGAQAGVKGYEREHTPVSEDHSQADGPTLPAATPDRDGDTHANTIADSHGHRDAVTDPHTHRDLPPQPRLDAAHVDGEGRYPAR